MPMLSVANLVRVKVNHRTSQYSTMSRISDLCLLLLLLGLRTVDANFLADPSVQWSYTLPRAADSSRRRLRKGNAVVATQDDSLLFITTQDASLFILKTSDGLPVADAYQPLAANAITTTCQSGVALAEDENGVQYAVYAVIDTPNDNTAATTSRIIAVNPDGSERWNVFLDGIVAGTPAFGGDGDTMYVSHNVPNTVDNGEQRGKITVLRDNGGSPTIEAEAFAQNRFGPFGPLTVKSTMVNGVSSDTVFVAESWGGGYTPDNGYIFFLRDDDYTLQVFSTWGFSSATAPTVSVDSDMLWVAGVGTTVGGWIGESYFSALASEGPAEPDWQSIFVQNNLSNVTMEVSPVVSSDNLLLFISAVTGDSDEMYCVEASSGRLQWAHNSDDQGYVARPVYRSRDGDSRNGVLYTVSVPSGTIEQLETGQGSANWVYTCEDLTGSSCEDPVEAEFSVSSSDNTLYFGNIDGNIVALAVGTFDPPSAAPTTSPPSPAPTIPELAAPDTQPTLTLSPTVATDSTTPPMSSPTDGEGGPTLGENANGVNSNVQAPAPSGPNEKTTKALFGVAALVGALAIAILAFVFVGMKRRRRRKDSRLPVSEQWNQDSPDGSETGVVAGDFLDSSEGKAKQKKKKRSTSFSKDASSPRLEVIAEIPDDTMENASLESGVEIVHADEEEEDIENYVFDYAETTPDTSFSSYQSSAASPEKANNTKSAPDAREQAGSISGFVAALTGGTALAIISSRSYSASESVNDEAADKKPRKGEILDATRNNDSSSLEEDEVEVVTVTSNESSAYYMLDTSPGGAGSVIKVGSSQDEGYNDNESSEKESQPSQDNSRKSSSVAAASCHLASNRGDSQGAIGAIVPVNRGARSSYAIDNTGSDRSKSLLDTEEEGPGTIVPVARDENRSSYAMEPPSLSRDRSDANAKDGAMVHVDRKEDQYASGLGSKEHDLLFQKSRSVKSENSMSLASIDEDATPPKESAKVSVNHAPASSYYFHDQLSPCTSMYLEEDSTVATFESAPLDEKISRAQTTGVPINPDALSPIIPDSTLSPTPKRMNTVSQANQASVSLDAISPLTMERGDAPSTPKQSPLYVMGAPLSPGSTVGSTSLYVDDEGSVEMERNDITESSIPLDEKKSIPASVKLDACVLPQQMTLDTYKEPTKETSKISMRKSYSRKARHNNVTSGAPKLTEPPPLSPTSTSTNDSRSSSESASNYLRPLMDPGKSVRSLRKTRLEKTIRSWKVENHANRSQNELKPAAKPEPFWTRKSEEVPPTQLMPTMPSKRTPQHNVALTSACDDQTHTTGDKTIAPGSPRSFASRGIDSVDLVFPSSSDSDKSSEFPAPPVRRSNRRESSQRSQRNQTKRLSSNGGKREDRRKSGGRPSSTQRRSQRKSTTSASRTSNAEERKENKSAAITSLLTGFITRVEEAERQFFNPSLPTSPDSSKASIRQDNGYGAYSSDEDSLPPPPPVQY